VDKFEIYNTTDDEVLLECLIGQCGWGWDVNGWKLDEIIEHAQNHREYCN
jgi:hypothetical protein